MATKLRKDLRDRITEKTGRQAEMIAQMEAAKDNVDVVLNECISKMMSDEDIINNEEYIKYFNSQPGAPASVDESLKDEWIQSLDREDRIELAAEYSKVGKDKWIKDATDAQEIKEQTKKALEQNGEEILAELDNLVKEFDEEISRKEKEINDDIKRIQNTIDGYKSEIKDLQKQKNGVETNFLKKSGKSGPRTKEEIDVYNKSIDEYNNKIAEIEAKVKEQEEELDKKIKDLKKLRDLKSQRNLYIDEIKREKERFAAELRNSPAKLKIGKFKGEKDKSSSIQESNAGTVPSSIGSVSTKPDKTRPVKIAKNKTKSLMEKSDYEIIKMLENSGYEELLNTSRKTGLIDSDRINKIVSDLLDKLEGDLVLPDGTKLTKKELYNLANVSSKKKRIINSIITDYEDKYDKLHGDDRIKADEITKYLKLSVILTESHASRFQRWRRSNTKNNVITRIGNGLKNIALKQGDIKEVHKESTIKQLYKVYGLEYKKDRKAIKTTQLNKDGIDPIQR